MRKIAKTDYPFERQELPRADAIPFFRERGEPYKVEILEGIDAPRVSLYRQGEFVDLCRGPHVRSTGEVKHFKLLASSGAYWRGDERNPMLQRIYGTAWLSQEELERHVWRLEEAKKRDHRKLGRELDLFIFNEVSPGAPFWLPHGWTIVRELELVSDWYKTFALDPFFKLSTRPPKSLGTDEQWETAERALHDALKANGLAYDLNPGDGAFYGPKVDIDVQDALGRRWQLATIQIDFAQPDRFELEYIDSDGHARRPVMVHRAIFGTFERFIGVLTEHYAGAFPTWLAPVPPRGLPVSEKHTTYGRTVWEKLRAARLRAELDDRNEKLGYRIREAQLRKVPYMLVVGERESQNGTVSLRHRSGEDLGAVPLDRVLADLAREIGSRASGLTVGRS